MAGTTREAFEQLDPQIGPPTTPPSPLPTAQRGETFNFPTYCSFPPFYTLQPNLTTRARQFALWSKLITSYCAHHHLFRLALSSLPDDLFSNGAIHRSLNHNDIRAVLDWMARPENGGRAEWVAPTARNERSSTCYVYWRTPAEWADVIHAWVEETGQKNAVLTFYELRQGDAVRNKDWRDMDDDLLRKVLNVLVRRGKAQIFGQEETSGIKFF